MYATCRRMFQGAVSGAAGDHTTALEIDKAFPPGFSIPDSFQRYAAALHYMHLQQEMSMKLADVWAVPGLLYICSGIIVTVCMRCMRKLIVSSFHFSIAQCSTAWHSTAQQEPSTYNSGGSNCRQV